MGKREAQTWSAVRLIAHRCGGELAPENSLSGLRAAAAAGYQAVEFDVMLSGSGTPWLMHDDNLERTSFTRGEVGQMSDADLSRVDISRGFPERFRGERLPRFDDAALLCKALALLPNIEIKPYPGQEARTGEVVARAARRSQLDAADVLLSSFSETALAAAQRAEPGLARALLFESVPADWLRRVERLAAVAVHCSVRQSDWSWLADAHAHGLAVRCYTVNDGGTAKQLLDMGVDALFTDAVGRLTV